MINIDAAVNKEHDCFSSGMVIKDSLGKVIASSSTFINCAYQAGSRIVGHKRLNQSCGRIFLDCSLAVGMLNRPLEESGDLDLLVVGISREAEDQGILSVQFGPRSSNYVAHLIAKNVIRYQAFGFWEGGVPPMVSLAFAEDLSFPAGG
ncbi:uncharacterized protein LOC133789934 [Humulus lupulus]|uniref:uncharacterized protein LOC133789934 n=1 Tax=Humulus lupulus TaxID=3486 RepID=UPI002B40DDAC|nr:uncharacterized protein LOC133789934 [Humulus lupulus]